MTYGLDPRFRFTVARAIYKGIVRYLNGAETPIQPLAPNTLAIEKKGGKTIRLSWKNTEDPLEPTANAARYRIYMRTDDNGFSPKFKEVTGESAEIELPEWGRRYSFKVTGVNDGGESFPTEQLSACLFNNSKKPALIVNGFTRISAPKSFDLGEKAGFEWWEDEGVADGMEPAFLGYQQNFNRTNLGSMTTIPDGARLALNGGETPCMGTPMISPTFKVKLTKNGAYRTFRQVAKPSKSIPN